jgi:signal transduction histidine kinase
VKSQAQRLHSLLVEHLASDATLAVDEPDVPLSPCSVAEFLESVVGPLRARAEVADVHLTIDCGGGTIQADERALGEAIFNLVANAIEATPRGGHVTLETRVLTTGEQRWVVRDTGAGLPVSQLVHFGRGGRSTKIGGSGLGVALSRAAVDRHGGRLEVESQDALGTTVTISLGRANGHDQTAAG